jgi:aspartyl-tRNA synthetase
VRIDQCQHAYRSCADLNKDSVGDTARLSGAPMCVTTVGCCSLICATITASRRSQRTPTARFFSDIERCAADGVSALTAEVKARDASSKLMKLPTGEIRVFIRDEVLGAAAELPLMVAIRDIRKKPV